MTPIPIPDRLTKLLSTRAHRILDRESIQSCQELLKLREVDLFVFRGSGTKTVRELTRLQRRILKEYPHLIFHYVQDQKVAPRSTKLPSTKLPSTKLPDKNLAVGPADWSLLNRSLPDLCRLSPLPFSYQLEPETNIDSLGLPAADLERLRSIAVLPEDCIHLLYSLTTGYLIQAGLSDVALSIMLAAAARISGPAGVALQSRSKQEAPDASLYAELSSGALDRLFVPGFRFPALLGIANSDTPTVPWGTVARINERTVVQTLGISVTALRAIRYLWQLQERALSIAESARAGLPIQSYGDFTRLVEGYLQLVVAKKCGHSRDHERAEQWRQVLRGRLRMIDGRKWTLSELGQQYGVTRESIRQMESKLLAFLKSPGTLQHLDYLWYLLDHLLITGGGVRYLGELCVSLRDILGWPHLPSQEALGSIMELSTKYKVVWNSPMPVALAGSCCVGCATSERAVLRALETARDMVLSVDAALEMMLEVCQRERCPELGKITGFSKSIFDYRAGTAAEIMVEGEQLCFPDARERKAADKQHVLEQIVLAAGEGVHFKEAQRRYNLVAPGAPVSEGSMHGWLFDNPSFLLWGPGTFKHRDLVRVPTSLIAAIQQDLLARLDCDEIPYLCLNGSVFQKYRDRLRIAGVPTPQALYTCMRIVGSATMTFTEYPYACRKNGTEPRPPIWALIESFVSRHAGLVAVEQIRSFGIYKVGVPVEQLGNHLQSMCKVVRFGNLRLHLDKVPMVTKRLGTIARELSKLEPGGTITKERLYRENHAACQALGITTPAQLASLIKHFFPGTMNISRQGRNPAVKRSGPPRVPVARQVISYLEEQARPCKTKELLDLFRDKVSDRHYLYNLSLGDNEKILWYSKDSVIARRTLEWSREKQAAIEALAFRHQEQRVKGAKPYGLCSEMYREMGGELPEIAPHLSWTPVLLQSLLGSGKFLALGRQRDVFIPRINPHHIATLDDLYFYTLLTEYGGAASLRAFTSRLRRSGLMKKKVPRFLQGRDRRVIIEGDVIRVADLDTAPVANGIGYRYIDN